MKSTPDRSRNSGLEVLRQPEPAPLRKSGLSDPDPHRGQEAATGRGLRLGEAQVRTFGNIYIWLSEIVKRQKMKFYVNSLPHLSMKFCTQV
jgi:hypothetical protein